MVARMSETNPEYRVVLCTAGSDAQAREIARALVERRLAACVNVVPGVCSTYRWRGEIVEEGETLMIVKTAASRIEALRLAVRELHSYDTPEILVLDVCGGDPDYLAWLGESLSSA
jgi:periplasmic divalent cation tolerance protein